MWVKHPGQPAPMLVDDATLPYWRGLGFVEWEPDGSGGGLTDTGVAALVQDDASATAGALRAAYGRPLARWQQKLGTDPTTARIAFVGDSTSTYGVMQGMFDKLRDHHTQPGLPLAGMQAANIIAGGHNGASLAAWLDDATGPNALDYSLADLRADAPHLIVASWGINDVRLGGTTQAQLVARLGQFLDLMAAEVPGADVLLRMPNSLTTTVSGTDYVDGITHQAATDLLRAAYLEVRGTRGVPVADTQADVFGITALPTSPLMADEVHPSIAGARLLADYLAERHIGRPQRRRSAIGPTGYRWTAHGYIISAGTGYFDLAVSPGDSEVVPAVEWPVAPADLLVVDGYGTLPLTGSTFGANGPHLRVLKTGDWAPLIGKQYTIGGSHPGQGAQGGRHFFTLDPGPVAAGATLDVTTTVSGITRENGVVLQPPSAILATGLLWAACISADNTVTIRLYNPTAAPIDMASNTGWRLWIVR